MSHQVGANIGGATSLACIHNRCFVDDDTGCWHFRTAGGRPMLKGKSHKLWVYGVGAATVTRAAWAFHTGAQIPARKVVSRICASYDCANPAHLRCWGKGDEGAHLAKVGRFKGSIKRVAANTLNARPLAKLTPELAQWARESGQSLIAAAHGLDISPSGVGNIRCGKSWRVGAPSASVFAWSKK